MVLSCFNPGLLPESGEQGNSPISQVLLGQPYFPGSPFPTSHLSNRYHSPQQMSSVHVVSLFCVSPLYLRITHAREGFGEEVSVS